ncbi:probable fatty acyl-CoA reductase 4 [Aristolochia californica]|uniref:probable fatty acyl-CoA reductase 4 n=1 Tax=Aristolochia californica TaxID=171875 RepID=UPI0035DE66DA
MKKILSSLNAATRGRWIDFSERVSFFVLRRKSGAQIAESLRNPQGFAGGPQLLWSVFDFLINGKIDTAEMDDRTGFCNCYLSARSYRTDFSHGVQQCGRILAWQEHTVFVEKVLRVQPQVQRIYLLLRAPDNAAAAERLETQVLSKALFEALREAHGASFSSFVSDKLRAIAGNIADENIGIDDSSVMEQLKDELDVIVHSAATTKFDERYDVAFSTNTLGAKHVMEFAKKCVKLGMLLHVSTAFVAGEKAGLIPERSFRMGEALNGTSTVDIDEELKLVESKLKELDDKGITEERKGVFMKELGLQRARSFGWPNTYVFTKAMGEMLLGHLRGHVPLVIVRPTIVTTTYMEPFPGWIENCRGVDSLIVAYALGKLKYFIVDPSSIMDVIPGDMVVNAMVMLLAAHFHQSSEHIYHLCSSLRNPPTCYKLGDWCHLYFSKHSLMGKDGKPIKVKKISFKNTMSSFNRFMNLHYKLPLQAFYIVNQATCHLFGDKYKKLNKKYNYAKRVALLYKPYILFKGRFDDSNSEWLRMASNIDSERKFHYGIQDMDWDSYFMNWDVVKYLLRYFCGTLNHDIVLHRQSSLSLHVFFDADWAGNEDDFTFLGVYLVYLGRNPIS